jgi:hypothetical protein
VALFNMPAAGKCRKGVFKMKKLLVVLLVPFLVLGVMSCGGGFDAETANLTQLQGSWVSDASTISEDIAFVLTASEITIFRPDYDKDFGTLAMGTSFELSSDVATDGSFDGLMTITRLDDGAEIGWAYVYFVPNGSNPQLDLIEISWSGAYFSYQTHMIPPMGTYSRIVSATVSP